VILDISSCFNAIVTNNHTAIRWRELPGKKLQAYWQPDASDNGIGITDEDMKTIHEWSKQIGCGYRISFDTWQFETQLEITMFLLKWSSA